MNMYINKELIKECISQYGVNSKKAVESIVSGGSDAINDYMNMAQSSYLAQLKEMEVIAKDLLDKKQYTDYVCQLAINEMFEAISKFGDNFSDIDEYLDDKINNPSELTDRFSLKVEKEAKGSKHLKIMGYRRELFTEPNLTESCDSYSEDEVEYIDNEVIVLCCQDNFQRKYEIRAYTNEDSCGSGWCMSTYGYVDLRRVELYTITARAKVPFNLSIPQYINGDMNVDYMPIGSEGSLCGDDMEETCFEIPGMLKVSAHGGDRYYPEGYVEFTPEGLFHPESIRQMNKRPVWLFKGDSGLGKTYLSDILYQFGNKTKYETDQHTVLPDVILEDIIVLGNRTDFTVEEIKSKIKGSYELIIVDFSKEEC